MQICVCVGTKILGKAHSFLLPVRVNSEFVLFISLKTYYRTKVLEHTILYKVSATQIFHNQFQVVMNNYILLTLCSPVFPNILVC